jgi:hypothetical protein
MNVIGYSERGMINSLIYEIYYKEDARTKFEEFLSKQIKSNFNINDSFTIEEILVEQSFSEFGAADLVLLNRWKGKENGFSIFIEAKVKAGNKKICKRLQEFTDNVIIKKEKPSEKLRSSNLFAQLYLKMRLVEELEKQNRTSQSDQEILEIIVNEPVWLTKSATNHRSLGKNAVVQNAAKKVLGYLKSCFFIAIVPDSNKDITSFCSEKELKNLTNIASGWRNDRFALVTWNDIYQLCKDNEKCFKNTLKVFDYNKDQIY